MTVLKTLTRLASTRAQPKPLELISSANKWMKQLDQYPPGVFTSKIDLPTAKDITLPDFIFQNLHKWENTPLIQCGETGRKYTHGDVYKKSQSFAASLLQAGIKRYDTICVLLPNIPEYPIVSLGIMLAGGIVSPINPNFTQNEIVNQIQDCNGKVVITTAELIPMVNALRSKCPTLTEKTIVVGQPTQNCHTFSEMIKTDTLGVEFLKGSHFRNEDSICFLAYSSGTTGAPKGVQHTHTSLVQSLKQLSHPEFCQTNFFVGNNPQDRYVSILPFFHAYGFHAILSMALYHGSRFYSLPKFEPQSFLKALLSEKPTVLHLVTPLINWLVQDPSVPRNALSELRGIFIGAAPVGKELMTKFQNKFGTDIFLQEGYGMTEVLATHFVPKETHNSKTGSCGVLLPGVTCKVEDVSTGELLGPNEPGEICCASGSMMKGYLGNEEATRFTIREDGFLHTGDIGYYDEDGFYYIVDRCKDLIKVKGLQVSPSELENVLRHHPDIADVAVVGVPHERMGEAPRAYVIKKNSKLSEQDISVFLNTRMAAHKQLSGGIEFVKEIPKTPSGKILKRTLRADFMARKDSI